MATETDLPEFLRRNAIDIFVSAVLLASVFVAGFGATNWNSYCEPTPPAKTELVSEQTWEQRVATHNRKVERVGKDAVVPLPWAVALTFTGGVGAALAAIVFAYRYGG